MDFGSQYTQLIARRVREAKVYCEIVPFTISAEKITGKFPSGLIFSGGPSNVYASGAPHPDAGIFELGIPILGICYGMQLIAQFEKGKVYPGRHREYGLARLTVKREHALFKGLPRIFPVWMSHGDRIGKIPKGYTTIAHTDNAHHAVFCSKENTRFGLQFHPEVKHTPSGMRIIKNYLFNICKEKPSWTMKNFIKEQINDIRSRVGRAKVLCALSGGVDSSVVSVLVRRAVGRQLHCVFVDNGVLRSGEKKRVQKKFKPIFKDRLHLVDARKIFLNRLKGIEDPERKRKIIGNAFIHVFEKVAKKIGNIDFLVQGTLYPDVIESVSVKGPSATIKTHHNVGGLPDRMRLRLIEPLRYLFKDEVRLLGKELRLPDEIILRQPFPGPGLAVRILGPVTPYRLAILRQSDCIVEEEVRRAGIYERMWQSFAVLLPVKTVGVMGDERTYEQVIAIRAVESTDGMTADWVKLPYEVMGRISNRIINEVKGVNRVVYDISSKPPATIEWE